MSKDREYIGLVRLCLVTAIAFGITGLLLPPLGVIHNSVLILIAQLLVFCASILLNSATVAKHIPFNKEEINNKGIC